MSDESLPLSKKGQRIISEFVGHELVYDYVTLNLDPERTVAIDKLVQDTPELQVEIKKIKHALDYCDQLSGTLVTDALVDQIKTPSTYFQVILQKLKIEQWSPGLRLAAESLILAAIVVTAAMLVPWQKLSTFQFGDMHEIVLAEVSKEYTKKGAGESELANKAEIDKPLYVDESIAPQTSTTQPMATTTTVVVVASAPIAKTTTTVFKAITADSEEKSSSNKSGQGLLFRGSISVSNLNATTAKFIEKITEFGGRKAGEVDLGWKKGSGTYFHFTMPEKQYEELIQFMNSYGKLKIQKEKHPRVMPEGIIRLIITVDESGGKRK